MTLLLSKSYKILSRNHEKSDTITSWTSGLFGYAPAFGTERPNFEPRSGPNAMILYIPPRTASFQSLIMSIRPPH